MKKILLVTIDFWPKIGGVANYYFNLCRQLEKDKIVVLTENTKTQKTLKHRKHNFKVYRRNLLSHFIWPRWLPMLWQIWQVIRKEKIELIWVGEVLPSGTAVFFLSKFLKLPYIVSCHGNDILQAGKFSHKKKLAEKILRRAKWVTVNSQYTGELVKSLGVNWDKIKVVHPGVKLKIQSSKLKNKEELIYKYNLKGKKILLSISRLVERKGFDQVIESLPKVWQDVPDLTYVLIGTGEDEERLWGMIGQNDKIIFINKKISDQEKWAWFDLCHIFIMVSRADSDDVEGFGIVYLEANSFGKPVIAGNVGGVPDAVEDGVNGFLVNPENKDEIAGVIIKLFKDDNLCKKLGEQGRIRVEKEFSWDKSAEKFRELLNC